MGPHHLLDFFRHGGGHGRIADIGVDLHQEVAADGHRLQLGVIDVGGNDRAAGCHLVAHPFRRDEIRDRGAEGVAVPCRGGPHALPAEIFADRDEFHLRRHDALTRKRQLRHRLAGQGTIRPVHQRKDGCRLGSGNEAVVLRLHMPALILLDAALEPAPAMAKPRQSGRDIGSDGRVGIGARRVVDGYGRLVRCRMHGDLPQRHADFGVQRAGPVHLGGCGQRPAGDGGGYGIHVNLRIGDPAVGSDRKGPPGRAHAAASAEGRMYGDTMHGRAAHSIPTPVSTGSGS